MVDLNKKIGKFHFMIIPFRSFKNYKTGIIDMKQDLN